MLVQFLFVVECSDETYEGSFIVFTSDGDEI